MPLLDLVDAALSACLPPTQRTSSTMDIFIPFLARRQDAASSLPSIDFSSSTLILVRVFPATSAAPRLRHASSVQCALTGLSAPQQYHTAHSLAGQRQPALLGSPDPHAGPAERWLPLWSIQHTRRSASGLRGWCYGRSGVYESEAWTQHSDRGCCCSDTGPLPAICSRLTCLSCPPPSPASRVAQSSSHRMHHSH